MGIMDKLFGNPSAGLQGTGPNQGTPGSQHVANPVSSQNVAATLPANQQQQTTTPATDVDPVNSLLDPFKTLWDTPVDSAGKPIVINDPLSQPVLNFDPTKIREQAKSLDFVKDINPELLSKITSGGADSGAALLELLNTVQQNAFAASALMMGNTTNQALNLHSQALRKSLPRDISRAQLSQAPIGGEGREILEHPSVQPLVASLRNAAFNKDPNANPLEVATQIDNFILGLGEAVAATKTKEVKKQEAAAGTDWDSYFQNQ